MATKKQSHLSEALLETADGMHCIGIMNDKGYRKITLHHLGEKTLPTAQLSARNKSAPSAGRANLSQAAFARYLNLTSGYVSQLERGTKQPKGPALALLNVIRRKGFGAIL
jgi:putative transcriptional regulator